MQISTRTEDFIVDTLKLRIHVGPYLREVFKDPTKRKVGLFDSCNFFWPTALFDILNSHRLFMEQTGILCGFNGTLAYICAISLTLDRFYTVNPLLV